MSLGPLYVLLGEVSVQVLSHFLIGLFVHLGHKTIERFFCNWQQIPVHVILGVLHQAHRSCLCCFRFSGELKSLKVLCYLGII